MPPTAPSARLPLGFATSPDGVVWTVGDDPVIAHVPSASWERIWTYEPWVVHDKASATYRMWYAGADQNRCQIGYATSPDGLVWEKHADNPALRLDGAGWEQECIDGPSVILDGTTLKMWYSGGGSASDDNTGLWSLGYATSLDGVQWQKYAGNPVITGDSSGRSLFSPCVLLDSQTGTYEIWYTTTSDAIRTASTSYATSADGVTWCKHPGNPVFLAEDGGEWEFPKVM